MSFLLLNLLSGRPNPKNKSQTAALPQNNPKPPRSAAPRSAHSEKTSVVRRDKAQKNRVKGVNEISFPCDSVEISHTADKFNTAASAGNTGAAGEMPPHKTGGFAHSDKTAPSGGSDNSVANVLTGLGIFLIIVSLFIFPKGLLLTAVGALISVFGIRMEFKNR